ncbi:hypothetical protein [Streptomyces sp. NPDC059593]
MTIAGIDRTRIPEDSVVGVTLDRSVQPAGRSPPSARGHAMSG